MKLKNTTFYTLHLLHEQEIEQYKNTYQKSLQNTKEKLRVLQIEVEHATTAQQYWQSQFKESKSLRKRHDFLRKAISNQINQQQTEIISLNIELARLRRSNRDRIFNKDKRKSGPKNFK